MLKEGDIIELQMGHVVYADVPEHFVYSTRKGSFKMIHIDIIIDIDLDYLVGKYVVYKTVSDGGGTGHGPHDVYPNGYHVYCEKYDDTKVKVDFYQSGDFEAMIKDIKPVGKLPESGQMRLEIKFDLNGIISDLEYAAFNLCDGAKYTDLPENITESTGAKESLLIAIRDLKRFVLR
ncbi:hypothetical protein [Acinetobacter sp.]|uniref:hypothetical protein n=1 Tax=Acinetobacter sp. TaxID=472 RepID=UPI003CFE7701